MLKKFAGINGSTANYSPLSMLAPSVAVMTPGATPDYFGAPNYANSPLPQVDATGVVTGGMRKFVDTLPGLGPTGANNLGNYIPLATPDTTTFVGSDFYRIGLRDYQQQMHTDLPGGTSATKLKGYVELDATNTPIGVNHYLGPLILATKNRPVRILFKNMNTADLPIPVDTTYMGAGMVSDGINIRNSSLKRATLHLHGGNTPWISDGTTHQWITPAGGDGQPAAPGFAKGFSFMDVPDMVPPACAGAQCVNPAPSLTDGTQTFYWTNQQSGRLLWYHDHAFGLTRLNAYMGEAAGYLLVDPVQEAALLAAGAPGTIVTDPATGGILSADLAHVIPLVIQDKTFVPDNVAPGNQLAAQDPTWDVAKYGGVGNLWFPHVYTTNQNPADLSGANGFGRWDWGPWFFPPQNPASLAAQDFQCSSAATPATGWAFPPLMCPGVPFLGASANPAAVAAKVPDSPAGVPEGFLDTPVVNGTAYPSLTVNPAAYRFQILNGANDRTWNLGLYVADPLAISITANGSGYAPPPAAPPAVTLGAGCTGVGLVTASVDLNGAVISISVAPAVVGTPIVCTSTPTVSIAAPPAGTQAFAIASVNTEVKMVPAISAAGGRAMPNCPIPTAATGPTLWGGGQVTAQLDATGNPVNGTGLPANCWPMYYSPQGYTAGPFGEGGQLSWGNTDNRLGGVPDPTTAGPPIIQIGSEGGLLPQLSVIPSTPVSYDYNKRSITVLNVLNHGLLIGGAERADVIVDFSAFAGKTLILYNDAPAPVPAGDPRLDYFTNDTDFSATGGAPTTIAGYGPNVRTIMQIKVNAGTPAPLNLAPIAAALPGLFAATQDAVIVPEPGYPVGNGNGLAEYARIQDTSLTLNTVSPLCPALPCAAVPMKPKAIQELFTWDYGRMNATMGVEVPLTNFLNQTTIPYGYADPPTEIFKDGETQIWKITHNGVDTHFIHFHLFTVQVINRVGWDGAVKPPDPNELSFKDTVRMNPLEDIIVALKPMKQSPFPFAVPNSWRPLVVTAPIGGPCAECTNADPTNLPAPVINDMVNFGWEYVWHCHILGHEENDMMRPMILAVAPDVPVLSVSMSAVAPATSATASLTWTETSSNYTGFTIQKSVGDATFPAATTTSYTVGPSPLGWVDPTPVSTSIATFYRIMASNLVGYTRPFPAPSIGYPHVSADSLWSTAVNTLAGGLLTPTVTFTGAPATAAFNTSFTVTATTNASTMPTITGTGPCTVAAVTGSAASASALVTMTAGSGTCSLSAAWAADATYAAATAGPLVTTAVLATPTVTFTGAPVTAASGTTFTVTATTNAGVMPVITSANTLVCSVGAVGGTSASASATITAGNPGTCTLTASWAATANYAAATLTQIPLVGLAPPTVTFTGAPASAAYGTSFTVIATTNAGVQPAITVTPTSVCSIGPISGISPATATINVIIGTGTCSLLASWPQTATFAAASLTQATTATLAVPTVSFTGAPASAAYGSQYIVTATTTADTTVLPTITPTGVCFLSPVTGSPAVAGATVAITSGTGSCALTAAWPATSNFAAASLSQSTTASKLPSSTTITSNLPNPVLPNQPATVNFSVTAASGVGPTGSVTVNASGGGSCTGTLAAGVGSCTITFTTVGTRTLTAVYLGDVNYNTSTSPGVFQFVQGFTISVTPTAATISGGSRQRYTVTITSIGNWTGTVLITPSMVPTLPAGWTMSAPVNVTVRAGRTATATISVYTRTGARGLYTLTFTGTSGALTQKATATLTTTS